MYILSLETSTKIFSLAIAKDGKVLRYRNLKTERVLENSIVPAIDHVLGLAKVRFEQIDAFAIGLGPGSFTSLRVGLSMIKAFCMAAQKPVVGISSLDVIAMNVMGTPCDQVCVLTDARRNLLYACLYECSGQQLRRRSEHMLISAQELLDKVHGKTLFVGDGVPLCRSAIERMYHEHALRYKTGACRPLFAEEKYFLPSARSLLALAYPRIQQGQFDDVQRLTPIYLYPQDCQVERKP